LFDIISSPGHGTRCRRTSVRIVHRITRRTWPRFGSAELTIEPARPCHPRRPWSRGRRHPTSAAQDIVIVLLVSRAGQGWVYRNECWREGWELRQGSQILPGAKRRVEPALSRRAEVFPGRAEEDTARVAVPHDHCQLRRQWHTAPEPSSCPSGPTKDPGHPSGRTGRVSRRAAIALPACFPSPSPRTGWGTQPS